MHGWLVYRLCGHRAGQLAALFLSKYPGGFADRTNECDALICTQPLDLTNLIVDVTNLRFAPTGQYRSFRQFGSDSLRFFCCFFVLFCQAVAVLGD